MSVKSRRFVPRLEALDDRSLPSVTVTQTGTIVTVNGDDTANTITITDNGQATDGVTIVGDGQTFTPTRQIDAIVVNAFGGNDTVDYWLTGPSLASRNILVDLGRGDDQFTAHLSNQTLDSGAFLAITAYGRGGADNLVLDAQNLSTQANSQLLLDYEGGAGKDQINLGYSAGAVSLGNVILQQDLQHH